MALTSKIFFPPLAVSIYNLLLEKDELTAKEIANKLKILSHSVYRATRSLKQLGLIEWTGKRPARFKVKPFEEAIGNYLLLHEEWFHHSFSDSLSQTKNNSPQCLGICFIRDKKVMHDFLIEDFRTARETAYLIVSGLEAPTEIILGNKRAIERGVTIKTIAQETKSYSHEMLLNWRRMGIEVRVIKSIEARIFIFDQKVAYLSTYKPQDDNDVIGVRLAYPPIARLLSELFITRWKSAKII